MSSRLSRRRFLKAAGATAGAVAWLSISRRVLGANERLNIACVGVGERGEEDLKEVAGENIVAMADVDDKFMAKATSDHAPKARQFTDYRKMLDAVGKEIDAVVVATPDHSHAYAGLWAMRTGKHLYCEKPLAHNVREARLMREEAKRRKLVTQMGTQIHAGDNYRRVVELVRAGAVGPVQGGPRLCQRQVRARRATQGPAGGPGEPALGPVARPGAAAAVQPGVSPVQVARVVGVRRGDDVGLRLPHDGRRPLGAGPDGARKRSRPRARRCTRNRRRRG